MATTEHTINDALADVLRQTRRSWQAQGVVVSETTGTLKAGRKQPDILIIEPNTSPVAIETEILPAATVESDAISRLGEKFSATGRTIFSSIAIRLPAELRKCQGSAALQVALSHASGIEMALYSGGGSEEATRFPGSGWISGSASDLSNLAQFASVPPDVIDKAASVLAEGVSDASGMLAEMARTHAGAIHKVSAELRQEDGEQTRRMAMTVLANAFVFHENLAGGPGELAAVKSIEELRGADSTLPKAAILSEWRKILKLVFNTTLLHLSLSQ
jgi:hypothetical protein